ncbi:unnamed protein product [Urochloa decumbens]|uniref:UBC core domain-containing protein n=1 Tax=Urochloa decumbens TaxID=240449 RepID=A0ABC9F3Y3_9POAL
MQEQDATGQTIFKLDLVTFETTGGAHHDDRGLAVKAHTTAGGEKLINVLRADGTEVAKKPCDLTVVDRSFFPGMAVASTSDPSRQPGVITGVTTELDLAQLDSEGPTVVATGVSPGEVRSVLELNVGDYVVSGTWLGRVVEVSIDVDVLFGDGSVCRVTRAGDKLRVVAKRFWSGHKNAILPGDAVVSGGDASVFRASRWLKGHWKPSRGEEGGTVAKVETGGVLVYWVVTSCADPASSAPPAYLLQPNDTHNLTFFCSGDAIRMWLWGVSLRCFFRRPPPTDDPSSSSASTAPNKKKHALWRRRRRVHPGRLAAQQRPMAIADTHTTVDVLWQDGTRQRGLPSASLHRIKVRNEQDLFPGQRVIISSPHVVAAPAVAGRVGIVKSLSFKDQTACVSWAGESSDEVVDSAVMSTYDLARSPDHKFFYGNIVVRRQPRQESSDVEEAVSVQGNTNDLSWVGHIVDLCDAHFIHVKWGDGNTSKVLLHDIAIVKPRCVDEILKEMGDWVSDDEDDDASGKAQEDMMPQGNPALTVSEPDHYHYIVALLLTPLINKDNHILCLIQDNTIDAEDGPVGETAMGRVGNIIKACIRTLTGMLAQGKTMYMLSRSTASASTAEPAMTENIQTHSPMISDDGDCHGLEDAAAEASHDTGDNVFRFKHFDVVQCPQDHHYLDNKEQAGGGGRTWLKRLQKEWKILETSLSDTIYVRGFEDRMDLLRAVMVGASGTPYHDGLFFFDLKLPPSYPVAPPQVKYHSFGLRVNPNLYPSGTVCLSLLNTFGGKGVELWSPEESSVLQVVVSIQGLVLTAKPYYNETGYAAQVGTPEGHRNELPYCENTYLLNLHTMLNLIRRPPAGFEEFVRDHFHRRGRHILLACEAYLHEGCLVGTLDDEVLATEASREQSCSVGFRLALSNVVPRLVEAFAGIGAPKQTMSSAQSN